MLVIPAINCKDFKCVKEKLEKAGEFLPKLKSERWVQIDISDGLFTPVNTWNNPLQLKRFKTGNPAVKDVSFEIHLMVNNLHPNVVKWLDFGAKRIIFHFEDLDENELKFLKKIKEKNEASKSGQTLGIAITSKTPIESIVPFLEDFGFVQLLAVTPGYSGEQFNEETIDKIKFLKKNHPKVIIEIDGGINSETTKLVKKAGADIIIAGSYIFDSKNPGEAYKKLSLI